MLNNESKACKYSHRGSIDLYIIHAYINITIESKKREETSK